MFEIANLPQVTIGAVEGRARGAGNELLMALDMRFAALPRGSSPGHCFLQLLPERPCRRAAAFPIPSPDEQPHLRRDGAFPGRGSSLLHVLAYLLAAM